MIEWLEAEGVGRGTVTYKLRDWLFSRQRYWGEPFPVLHHENGDVELVPESELPLTLPELEDFAPSGEGYEPPLARVKEWIETTDAQGRRVLRDANTMPQWAGSCWYFLRFLDPHNDAAPWSAEAEQYWMPVDLYVGGAEHAVLHLLYSRFWHKVFYDLGLVSTKEPFQKLVNQGMILGESFRFYDDNPGDDPGKTPTRYASEAVDETGDGPVAKDDGRALKARWLQLREVTLDEERNALHPDDPALALERVVEKMSKSRGNVINPDDVIREHGADAMRLYEMFIGPLEKSAPWSTEGIQGMDRFLQRAWRLFHGEAAEGEEDRFVAPEPGRGDRSPATPHGADDRRRDRRPRAHALQHGDLEADGLRPRRLEGRRAPARERGGLPADARADGAASRRGALVAPRSRRDARLRELAGRGCLAARRGPDQPRRPAQRQEARRDLGRGGRRTRKRCAPPRSPSTRSRRVSMGASRRR